MATISLRELLNRWRREALTPEQTIGQILQHLQELEKRLSALEKKVHRPPADRRQ